MFGSMLETLTSWWATGAERSSESVSESELAPILINLLTSDEGYAEAEPKPEPKPEPEASKYVTLLYSPNIANPSTIHSTSYDMVSALFKNDTNTQNSDSENTETHSTYSSEPVKSSGIIRNLVTSLLQPKEGDKKDSHAESADAQSHEAQACDQRATSSKDDRTVKYYVEVHVLATSERNSTGHLSVTFREINPQTGAVLDTNHTSYTVDGGLVATLVTAVSLGSVPVPSRNAKEDYAKDKAKADQVLIIELTKENYEAGRRAQEKINEEIARSHSVYSVTGPLNPIAQLATAMLYSANEVYADQVSNSCVENEDPCGIAVSSAGPSTRDGNETPFSPPAVRNCVSTSVEILKAAGVDASKIKFFPQEAEALVDQGFEREEKLQETEDDDTTPMMHGGF